MQRQQRLFRRTALERLSSPEQLDLLMQLTSPRAWITLLGIVCVLGALIVWGAVGSIPIVVAGEAILLTGGESITSVAAPVTGLLTDVYVNVKDPVVLNQIIARIRQNDGTSLPIVSPASGRIIETLVSSGEFLSQGETLLSIEPSSDDTDLQAIIYLSATDGKKVAPGMQVQIVPATVRAEEVGVLLAWVVSVDEFPESTRSMNQVLQNQDLTDYFFNSTEGAPIEVRADLIPARNTPTGYKWTSPMGPDTEIRSATLAKATIIIREQAPINLILGGNE
jgi:multidrug resistance efflux pump